jgi:hypothetical protein
MNSTTLPPLTLNQNSDSTHIHQTFAAQLDTSIRLRQSTTADRLAKIKKLKEAVRFRRFW